MRVRTNFFGIYCGFGGKAQFSENKIEHKSKHNK